MESRTFSTQRAPHRRTATIAPLPLLSPDNKNITNLSKVRRSPPTVAILLCTYQGQRYLEEQLNSYNSQTHTNWNLWVSDDGSNDETCSILENYKLNGKIFKLKGPKKGISANFFSLINNDKISADYYAYSDQDDIWEKNKLERAINKLETVSENTPALYCSRTLLVSNNNEQIKLSPLAKRPPSFANALVQNIGGGNTMVFNNAARSLIKQTQCDSLFMHDWWSYIIISGSGGHIFYDAYPTVRYRQHSDNRIGRNCTWSGRLKRLSFLWQGKFQDWNDKHVLVLKQFEDNLTRENRIAFSHFTTAREKPLITRLIYFKRSGIYRQNLQGNLGLLFAAIFRKI